MEEVKKEEKNLLEIFNKAKYSNSEYLRELEKFLDRVNNVENEELRNEIIYKMHRLENIVSGIAMEIIIQYIKEEK